MTATESPLLRPGNRALGEALLAIKFAGVSLLGFALDFILFRAASWAGLEPAWARAFSLTCAMQLTFVVNRQHVFRVRETGGVASQWLRYMGSNGVGNGCNYFIFVAMVSTHWPIVATPIVALATSSLAAWVINFLCNRYFVFRATRIAARLARHPPARGNAASR